MSGSISRQNAIQAVIDGTYVEPMNYIDNPVTEFYGCNVFTDEVMKARLPKTLTNQLKLLLKLVLILILTLQTLLLQL